MKKFQKLLQIAMGQFSEDLYNFVETWEPKDLPISIHSANDGEEMK